MDRILRVILIIALASVLVVGLATAGCNSADTNGNANGNANGDTNGSINGDTNDSDTTDSDEIAEPDLTSGLGTVIDCDENASGSFAAGDPAPDFRFQDALGQTFSLSDFQGKMVMVNFWATWCGYCVKELPYIQQIYEEWSSDELVLLAIDVGESAEKVSAYLAEKGISLPVVVDTEGKTVVPYLVSGIPHTFFIDKYGGVQYIMSGAFSSVEDIENILGQLKALQGD